MNDNVKDGDEPEADVAEIGGQRDGQEGWGVVVGSEFLRKLVVELHVLGVEVSLEVVVGRHRLDQLADPVPEVHFSAGSLGSLCVGVCSRCYPRILPFL